MTVVSNTLSAFVEHDDYGRFVSDVDGELTVTVPRADVEEWAGFDTLDLLLLLLPEYVTEGLQEFRSDLPLEIQEVREWAVKSVVLSDPGDSWSVVVTAKEWEARTL